MKRLHILRSRSARRLLSLAAALPLLAWTGYAIALASLSLSPASVTVGTNSSGTVTLDAAPAKGSVSVTLSSTVPSVATVPSSVSFSSLTNQSSRTFAIQTSSAGCSEVVASYNGVQKRALLSVQPPANPSGAPSLTFSRNPTVGGGTLTGTVTIAAPVGQYTVSLASSNTAIATVPASVVVNVSLVGDGPTVGQASFPITTVANQPVRCSVISATRSGVTGRKLLTVLPISG